MSRRVRQKHLREINLVPFMDVLLVLLIIFMVGAPIAVQGVKVRLPEADGQALSANDQNTVVLSVDQRGSWVLEAGSAPVFGSQGREDKSNIRFIKVPISEQVGQGKSADRERFWKFLQSKQKQSDQLKLVVRGDAQAPYASIAQLLAQLQQTGFTNVSLLTATMQ